MKDCSLLYCDTFVSTSQAAVIQRALVAEWYQLCGIVDTRDTCAVSRYFYCYDHRRISWALRYWSCTSIDEKYRGIVCIAQHYTTVCICAHSHRWLHESTFRECHMMCGVEPLCRACTDACVLCRRKRKLTSTRINVSLPQKVVVTDFTNLPRGGLAFQTVPGYIGRPTLSAIS